MICVHPRRDGTGGAPLPARPSTQVVDVEDVWDEFNHGVASPWAVRDFLAWAHRKWRPRPRFVVLAGSGSLDPRDNLGHGGNLLTPVLVTTPYGLAASDQALAELAGDDGVPEVAIGRIPALTNDELQAYVDKLIAVESARGPWRRKVVLLVDNPDGAGDFPAYSDAVARLLPRTFSRQKIYLSGTNTAAAREALGLAWSNGVDWVNYVGHGGLDRLAERSPACQGRGTWRRRTGGVAVTRPPRRTCSI